jgi:subtilisin
MGSRLGSSVFALLVACAMCSSAWAQPGPPQDRYIVVLKEGVGLPEDVAADVALRTNGRVGYVYEHALRGFSLTMPRAARARVAGDPRISYIEEDIPVTAFGQMVPTGVDRIFADHTALGINGADDLRVDADVAVIDTGIDRQHPDLNVVGGANCLQSTGGGPPWVRTYYCDDGQDGDDDHYHGTHVAGTIGALYNGFGVVGVAPGARLWAVKVLDSQGSGYLSGIIAGIDWVASKGDIEVINMSLGGSGRSEAMDTAVKNAVASGVAVVVAAGNEDDDAANHTPANAPDAITVSALADFDGMPGGGGSPTCRSDQDDTLADFSNWGNTVDIAAPGVCILSTFPIEQGEYGTISGTSMASPHVAGAAALLASQGNGPQAIRDVLIGEGNKNWVDDSGDEVQEPLLDVSSTMTFAPALISGDSSGGDGGGNSAPVANDNSASTSEDTAVTIDVLSNDTDDDGDSLSVASVTQGTSGSVEINTNHTVTYTPNNGFAGTDSFSYTASDGTAESNSATVTVTVGAAAGGGELLASSTNEGSTWTAIVQMSDGSNLSGTWDYSGGSEECSGDTCFLAGIRKRESSVVFTRSVTEETVTIFKP